MQSARAKGPVLLVDSGNALFKAPGVTETARAKLILDAMAELGTAAMAAGARDLNLGADWLKAQAAQRKLTVLSANLRGPDGKPLFQASKVVEVGGLKVGLLGLSPMGAFPAGKGATGAAPVPAAIAEAKALRRKVDVVVVLAAVPYADALQLAREGDPFIDFVLQSHDARSGIAQRGGESTYVLPSGERGRQVGALTLSVLGKGAFVDLAEAERAAQTARILKEQVAEVRRRLEAAKDEEAKRSLKQTLASFQTRLAAVAGGAKAAEGKGAKRTFKLSFLNLGRDVPDDPAWKARVEKVEPPGGGGH